MISKSREFVRIITHFEGNLNILFVTGCFKWVRKYKFTYSLLS